MPRIIIGIELEKRRETANQVQKVLTDFGCLIKTRVGLHDVSEDGSYCGDNGLIILELIRETGGDSKKLVEELSGLDGVTVKKMEFS